MKKILIAEDDRNLSRSIDILLTLEGFQVLAVHNGEEALNMLLQQKFDLLITDIVMPNLSGLDLIRKIRLVNSEIPIMVVSGKLNSEILAELETRDIKFVLPKPIKPLEFRKMVSQVFEEEIRSE